MTEQENARTLHEFGFCIVLLVVGPFLMLLYPSERPVKRRYTACIAISVLLWPLTVAYSVGYIP